MTTFPSSVAAAPLAAVVVSVPELLPQAAKESPITAAISAAKARFIFICHFLLIYIYDRTTEILTRLPVRTPVVLSSLYLISIPSSTYNGERQGHDLSDMQTHLQVSEEQRLLPVVQSTLLHSLQCRSYRSPHNQSA